MRAAVPVALGGSGKLKRSAKSALKNYGYKSADAFENHKRLQGVPADFDLPGFTVSAMPWTWLPAIDPVDQFSDVAPPRIVLPGATQEALKQMPEFKYTKMERQASRRWKALAGAGHG